MSQMAEEAKASSAIFFFFFFFFFFLLFFPNKKQNRKKGYLWENVTSKILPRLSDNNRPLLCVYLDEEAPLGEEEWGWVELVLFPPYFSLLVGPKPKTQNRAFCPPRKKKKNTQKLCSGCLSRC